jgi:hypothetical protein
MKPKFILSLALVLSGALILEIKFITPKEPSYQGRTLTQWLESGLPSNPILSRNILPPESQMAVKEIGANAIPTLLRMVQARDPSIESNYGYRQRAMAVMGFDVLGKDAKSAAPSLAVLAKDPDVNVRYAALDSLCRMNVDKEFMTGVLLSACRDSNESIQFLAASALHFVSPEAAEKAGIANPIETIFERARNQVNSPILK